MHYITPISISRISCRIFSRRLVLGFTEETRKKGEARLFLEMLLRLGDPDGLQLMATCVWLFELPYGTTVHHLRFRGGLHIPSPSFSAVYGSPFLDNHDLNIDAGSMGHKERA